MPKKKADTFKSIFWIVDDDNNYLACEVGLGDAEDYVTRNELDGAKILEVVRVIHCTFPEEPEMEFHDGTLEDLI